MRAVQSPARRPAGAGRQALTALGAAACLASLTGCFTTHTIAPDQLPAAVAPGPEKDQRRVVMGEDGKPVELPSPAHLRWVEIRSRSPGAKDAFVPPVSASVARDVLRVDDRESTGTYRLGDIESVRVRHDDHKADMIGGLVLLSFGTTFLAVAGTIVAVDFSQPERRDDGLTFEPKRGFMSALVGAPTGGVGLLLAIPGAVLTGRGALGLGQPPKERTGPPGGPLIAIGPGSAGVTVPF